MNGVTLNTEEFALFRKLIHYHTGIVLADSKRSLVEARLRPRLRDLKLTSFNGYYRLLQDTGGGPAELQELVNAITTPTTAFFREGIHFEFIARTLAAVWSSRRVHHGLSRIRVWSAACSTGEEPYSVAAVLHLTLPAPERFDIRILATDISSRALETAAVARYPLDTLAGVPRIYRAGFPISRVGATRQMTVDRTLKSMVMLRPLNLLSERYPFQRRFDLILCRNVLIYFDEQTRARLLAKLIAHLAPEGCLILGLSEAQIRVPREVRSLGSSIYQGVQPPQAGGDTGRFPDRA